jgi:hypothetical protein
LGLARLPSPTALVHSTVCRDSVKSVRGFLTALVGLGVAFFIGGCSGSGWTPGGESLKNSPRTSGGVVNPSDSGVHFLRLLQPPAYPPKPLHRISGAQIARARKAGWEKLGSVPSFPYGPQTELLLSDGGVLVFDLCSSQPYKLTPDQKGNYASGTWTQVASLPKGYAPLYFASAVLSDGKVIINGGEFNLCNGSDTNDGAIYDPVANAWTPVTAPSGWTQIGDAPSAVLADGTYMLGSCCSSHQALLNESSMTWTQVGKGKNDSDSEEGWTLLPNGNVFTVDIYNPPNAQYYSPSANMWESAGQTPVPLTRAYEIGPQTLLPSGKVWIAGASGNSATYNFVGNRWAQGPTFPVVNGEQTVVADGPSTLLVDGSVLVAASPLFNAPVTMLIYKENTLIQIPGMPNAPNDSSTSVRLLLLPTGQVLEDDGTQDMEIYTPNAHSLRSARPKILSVPTTLTHGSTYTAKGVLFNGVSQANMYGDDVQEATNWPLVRITNTETGDVFYCRTHAFSYMGVGSRRKVSTKFDVPSSIEAGASALVVVTNGIASEPVNVMIQ